MGLRLLGRSFAEKKVAHAPGFLRCDRVFVNCRITVQSLIAWLMIRLPGNYATKNKC